MYKTPVYISPFISLKEFSVTTLTIWGHVTSSVTTQVTLQVYFEYICWKFAGRLLDRVNTPLDSAWALSYWWSIVTMHLSCTVRLRRYKA